MKVRRVVTGHSAEGKAIFASDELVEPVVLEKLQGNEFHRLWGGDAVSVFPDDGSPPANPRYFPQVGGFRFAMFTVPPSSTEVRESPPPSTRSMIACPGSSNDCSACLSNAVVASTTA